jgi:integrase/recombinase XerD
MPEQPFGRGSLFSQTGSRKYLNAAERSRFVEAAARVPPKERLFCLTLRWSGARISEALALVPVSFDFESGVASFKTLKRRTPGIIRQVPLPTSLLGDLDAEFWIRDSQSDPTRAHRRLWNWSRTTAWRRVKLVMAVAAIVGAQAMPKGLRHSFGVDAFQSNVPPHLVQRWLGHASLETTAIYADVIGPEERAFGARMWTSPND